MKSFCERFEKIKAKYDAIKGRDKDLICKQGFYGNCPVLKLQKARWTNDDMTIVPNQTGIFFSIWLDDKSIAKNQAHYNIHALKLRQLKGYRITSIDFAQDFRKRFKTVQKDWPNVSVDFVPLTLMQGWIEIDASSFDRNVLGLMNQFGAVSKTIDELLATRSLSGVVASATTGGG